MKALDTLLNEATGQHFQPLFVVRTVTGAYQASRKRGDGYRIEYADNPVDALCLVLTPDAYDARSIQPSLRGLDADEESML